MEWLETHNISICKYVYISACAYFPEHHKYLTLHEVDDGFFLGCCCCYLYFLFVLLYRCRRIRAGMHKDRWSIQRIQIWNLYLYAKREWVRVVDGGKFVIQYRWKEIQQAKNNCILGDGKCRFAFMLPECTLTLCNALDYFITHHKKNTTTTTVKKKDPSIHCHLNGNFANEWRKQFTLKI